MFDEIKDFIAKHKIWFIICGIICAMFGAVIAALISLYFLIVLAVGLIVAVASGLVKNKEIQDLEKYKEEARKKITKEYIQRLLKSIEQNGKINKSQDMCSSLIHVNGFGCRGDNNALNIIQTHFSTVEIKNISKNFKTVIRGDIEILFEVLTGVEWSKCKCTNTYGLADGLCFNA